MQTLSVNCISDDMLGVDLWSSQACVSPCMVQMYMLYNSTQSPGSPLISVCTGECGRALNMNNSLLSSMRRDPIGSKLRPGLLLSWPWCISAASDELRVHIKCSPLSPPPLPQVRPRAAAGWLSIRCFQSIRREMMKLRAAHIFFMAATDVSWRAHLKQQMLTADDVSPVSCSTGI